MKLGFALAFFAAAATVPAAAGEMESGRDWHGHRSMAGPGMHRMDLNGDGAVSVAEAEAMRRVKFLRWDVDGNGVVTEEELIERALARIKRRIAERFARHDANGDGRIEAAEFEETAAARFAEADADGDGLLTRDELRSMRRGWHEGRRHRWHRD